MLLASHSKGAYDFRKNTNILTFVEVVLVLFSLKYEVSVFCTLSVFVSNYILHSMKIVLAKGLYEGYVGSEKLQRTKQ